MNQSFQIHRLNRPWQRLLLHRFVPVIAVLIATSVFSDEKVQRAELPKLTEMQLPSADELFQADDEDKEFDWIVLKAAVPEDRTVIVVNPIFPRPDTLKKMEEEYKLVESTKPQNAEEREKRVERLKELRNLVITLKGNLVSEYKLPVGNIDQIILFDELMLLRVDELLKTGEIRKAYELLLRVETAIPNWEKSVPRFERLLLVESSLRAQAGDIYAALALLDEAAKRNINNPELRPRFGELVGPMISDAVAQSDFRKARYLISRVENVFPDHPIVVQSKGQLQKMATDLLTEAAQQTQQRQFAKAAELAVRAEAVWPLTGNERAQFTQFFARHQVLRVASDELDGQSRIYPAKQESQERTGELLEVPLFEPSAADELTYFRSSYFETWDPTDLGREVVFSLRETRPHWQSQPILSANAIADALGHRIDATSPLFSPRLASFVSEISVRSPSVLRIRFSRVPLSIESLLRFPVTGRPADVVSADSAAPAEELSGDAATADGDPATQETVARSDAAKSDSQVVLSTRFDLVKSDESGRTFLRHRPEPDGLNSNLYHVAEIREIRFPDRDSVLRAMIRGDLDYLPHLQPWEIDAFLASDDFITQKYAIPMTHVITFNPMSERIVNAQMRRALSFAINRESILKSFILKDQSMKYGRPTSAAWHLTSYATNLTQKPPEFNMRLAYALRFAAERQLQIAEVTRLLGIAKAEAKKEKKIIDPEQFRKETSADYIHLPRLRFVTDEDPACIAAAERMMVYWERVGFEIDLIRGDQPGEPLKDEDWDFCYRRVRMEEPLLELWPLLANDDSLNMNRLAMFPDWMRQELINLDYSSSFLDAQTRLATIHRHIAAEAFLIPLWEVDEYAVWRKAILGIPERPMSTYHNVERWIVRP